MLSEIWVCNLGSQIRKKLIPDLRVKKPDSDPQQWKKSFGKIMYSEHECKCFFLYAKKSCITSLRSLIHWVGYGTLLSHSFSFLLTKNYEVNNLKIFKFFIKKVPIFCFSYISMNFQCPRKVCSHQEKTFRSCLAGIIWAWPHRLQA